MSRVSPNQRLMPSVIDRVKDLDFEGSGWSLDYRLDDVLVAVQRDLEDLLNSHPPVLRVEGGSAVLKESLLTYGLPDLASLAWVAAAEKTDIATLLKGVILRFEPRLSDVRVTLINAPDDLERRLRYRLDAKLRVEPSPEVVFETVLELATGQATVKPGAT
jgi:type VI secretion system protein ImpF